MGAEGRRRVLLVHAGEDAATAARGLRDAGHEVVLLGGGADVGVLARVALQEDVDEVALGAEAPEDLVVRLRALLEAEGAPDVQVRRTGPPTR